ncbi:MAG: restriction endonuclease subunit S, partial [Anaerolineae bacterium]|nr:restriction endonuclease subunit S [Anaerolineae bacterium]
KRSLMQRLFTYGPGSQPAPTKETEIGEIPEHWKVTPFGKVATLQRGKDLPKRKRKPGSYPIGGSNGIVGHHEEYVAHGPGVLVGRSGSVGKVTWIESAYWPLNTALWVKNYHGNDPHFIYYLLSYFDFSRYTSGVSVPTLNRNLVHPVKIGIPSIEEQRYVARILSVADAKIAVEEQRKAALEALFHSTLQQLMTGQIRLNAEPQSRGDAEGKP